MILKKATIANPNILRKTIKFPNGREVTLGTRGMRFIFIESKEDLDFISKQRGIQIYDLNEQEVREFLIKLPEQPKIGTEIKDPKRFVWYDENEELVLGELKKRGYVCNKAGTDPEFVEEDKTRNNLSRAANDSLIEEIANRIDSNSGLRIELLNKIGTNTPSEIDSMGFEELKAYLKTKGFSGLRIIKENQNEK